MPRWLRLAFWTVARWIAEGDARMAQAEWQSDRSLRHRSALQAAEARVAAVEGKLLALRREANEAACGEPGRRV